MSFNFFSKLFKKKSKNYPRSLSKSNKNNNSFIETKNDLDIQDYKNDVNKGNIRLGRSLSVYIPIEIKVCMVGGGGVGKSSVTLMYFEGIFSDDHYATIEEDIQFKKRINVGGELDRRAEIFVTDTAGQEEYKKLNVANYRNKDAHILVFDLTNKNTFEELEVLITEIQKANESHVVNGIIVGNKSDLSDQREVNRADAENFALKFRLPYIESSAKERTGIDEAFEYLINRLRIIRKEKDLQCEKNKKKRKFKQCEIKKSIEFMKVVKKKCNIYDPLITDEHDDKKKKKK